MKWESRFGPVTPENRDAFFAYVTMDGTDYRILQPTPRSKGWYSFKTNGPGKRYQIAVSVPTGLIVHIEGPYPAGHWPDITIYRRTLKELLLPGEMIIADKGYRGDPTVITPDDSVEPQVLDLMARARNRHEGINGMFKKYNILNNVYRGDRRKHEMIFKAVAVIVQIKLMAGEGSYSITDYDIPAPEAPNHPFGRAVEEVRDVIIGVANRDVAVQLEALPRGDETIANYPPTVTQDDDEE